MSAPFQSEPKPILQSLLECLGEDWIWSPLRPFSSYQRRALSTMKRCRTGVMGFHELACTHCGEMVSVPVGCNNRNCPGCGGNQAEDWVASRNEELLPTTYFHTVFTLPPALRDLFKGNFAELARLFMRSVVGLLLDLCKDERHLGAVPAVFAILHTANQQLHWHPHLHVAVTGGGYDPVTGLWKQPASNRFFLPVAAMKAGFKGRFITGLRTLFKQGKLVFDHPGVQHLSDPVTFNRLLDTVYRSSWVVFVKRAFGGPQHVIDYLSRYVFRTALSNSRILSVHDGQVTFRYKDRKAHCERTQTISIDKFVMRFGQHILPKGLRRVRYAGLLAPNRKKVLLPLARAAAVAAGNVLPTPPAKKPRPARTCPTCQQGTLFMVVTHLPHPPFRIEHALPPLPLPLPPIRAGPASSSCAA